MSFKSKIIIGIFSVIVYLLITQLVPKFAVIFYPLTLIVTFMHEFGHISSALITGGEILALQINPDGSGFAVTSGGSIIITLMGGYIGSAISGNLMLYIALIKERLVPFFTIFIIISMFISAILWYSSLFTTILLLIFAILLCYLLIKQKSILNFVFLIIGILSIVYIIQDFNVEPTSDIAKFSEILPGGFYFWMFTWLAIVIIISYFNFRTILKKA